MSFLAAFFGNAKAVLGAAVGIAVAVFLAVFKARGKEIEEQEEQIKDLEREAEFSSSLDEVSEEVKQGFLAEELEIEEEFNEKAEIIYKSTNKPLSPTLLGKLRSVQGLQNNSADTTE